jgi:adenine-specific DNA glycosylase
VLPVDQAVARVVRRFDDGARDVPTGRALRSVRTRLARELPKTAAAYGRAFRYLAHHAAATCTDTRPHCTICPVKDACAYGRPTIAE